MSRRGGHLWLELWQDPLWRQVLPRAVFYYLEANRQGRNALSFLGVKYTMAQAGLELLAWAILKEDPITAAESGPWHRDNGAAAKNVRELLTWAGIPSTVPAELPDLAQELIDMAKHLPAIVRCAPRRLAQFGTHPHSGGACVVEEHMLRSCRDPHTGVVGWPAG